MSKSVGDEGAGRGSGKPSVGAKKLAARLAAVQALYQITQNRQPMRAMVEEYLHHRAGMELDGEHMVKPDGALMQGILHGVDERHVELQPIIEASLNAGDVEPLLRSILLCGAYELLVHQDIDAPVIINDYLNVAHGFYGQNEVGLVNAVLDSIRKVVRAEESAE